MKRDGEREMKRDGEREEEREEGKVTNLCLHVG